MPPIGDARVLTRRETGMEGTGCDPERVARDIEKTRGSRFLVQLPTASGTSVPSVGSLELTAPWEAIVPKPPPKPEDGRAWRTLSDWASLRRERIDLATRATKATSTTVSSVGRLLRALHREQRVGRMPAGRREMYERIKSLRERIGRIDFDILEALREIRQGD